MEPPKDSRYKQAVENQKEGKNPKATRRFTFMSTKQGITKIFPVEAETTEEATIKAVKQAEENNEVFQGRVAESKSAYARAAKEAESN